MRTCAFVGMVGLFALGCSNSEGNGPDNPEDSGASGEAAPNEASLDGIAQCDPGFEPGEEIGVPTTDAGCLDTSQPEILPVCVGAESAASSVWFRCYRRRSDGVELWLWLDEDNHPDRALWESCDPGPEQSDRLPPPPCFAAACPTPPEPFHLRRIVSTCDEQPTREAFQCGTNPQRAWDESCCLRRPCTSDDDCAQGEECRQGYVESGILCANRLGPDGLDRMGCACSGAGEGPPQDFCFPR